MLHYQYSIVFENTHIVETFLMKNKIGSDRFRFFSLLVFVDTVYPHFGERKERIELKVVWQNSNQSATEKKIIILI